MKLIIPLFISIAMLGCSNDSPDLIYEEHFDGASLNMDYWNYELGDGCPNLCGWGNNERQLYNEDNLSIRDGNLVIKATKKGSKYESSRITTKNKIEVKYGVVEARAKLPKGHGLWPAIWMLGNDIDSNIWPACGEIDIMEYVGREPHTIYTSLHTPDSFGDTENSKKTINTNIEDGYHIYKVDWNHDRIQFFIDNRLVYTFSPEIKDNDTWPFDKPFYLLINMAIGGNFGGPEVDDSIFPQEFLIDYIKIYKS